MNKILNNTSPMFGQDVLIASSTAQRGLSEQAISPVQALDWYKQGWLTGAIHHPSPNFNARPDDVAIDLLVIHSISLPPDQFSSEDVIAFFQNRLDCSKDPFYAHLQGVTVSAHFFIQREGTIVQFVSTLDRAWHAGISAFKGRENCNDVSIGIELEGCDTMPFTEAQYHTLATLMHFLMQAYPGITRDRVVSHAEIALPPGRKTDPGPYFDWNHLWNVYEKR